MQTEGSLVTQTLNALKTRLQENNNSLQIQNEKGYLYQATCTFNPPASDEEIHHFEKQTGFLLPPDYKAFLKLTNGCRLFDDIHLGGEIELYSLQQIIDLNKHFTPYEGFYAIAYIYQDNILINSSAHSENKRNYLFWKGYIESFEEAKPLDSNFELWLDRFIVSQGVKFWWWSVYTAENYYEVF